MTVGVRNLHDELGIPLNGETGPDVVAEINQFLDACRA